MYLEVHLITLTLIIIIHFTEIWNYLEQVVPIRLI